MFSNKNILIAQGGGPTNVINMSLVSIIKEEKKLKSLIFGSLNGVNGIINIRFKNLNQIPDYDLKVISQTPGAALGSTRDKPDNKYCLEILKVLEKKKISKFYYIGGNDSSDSLRIISEHANKIGYTLQCIHIPKLLIMILFLMIIHLVLVLLQNMSPNCFQALIMTLNLFQEYI